MTDKSSPVIKYETRYIGGGFAPSAVVGQVEHCVYMAEFSLFHHQGRAV